jgi:PAS domain S-box-containing protein
VVVTAVIISVGSLYYTTKQQYFTQQTEGTLSAIAELKVSQLTHWWSECYSDCREIRSNRMLTRLLVNLGKGPARTKSQEMITAWMGSLQENRGYTSVILFDAGGRLLFSRVRRNVQPDSREMKAVDEVLQSGTVTFTDLHEADSTGEIACDFYAPVVQSLPEGESIVGVVLLRVDPSQDIFPLIESWPTPSLSSETNLVGRDGGSVVYLSAPRHQKVRALQLRFPLIDTTHVAVHAALGGGGFFEGIDYRGVPVKAFISAVPRTPWLLVAKTDLIEINDPLHSIAKWVSSLGLVLIIATGLVLGLWRRHQQVQIYHAKLDVETQRNQALAALHVAEDRFTKVFRRSPVPMCITRMSDGTILDVNESFVGLFGYTPEEILHHRAAEFGFWSDANDREIGMQALSANGSTVNLECPLKKKSGEKGMQLLSTERIELGGEPCLLTTTIDITNRKVMEEALLDSNERFEKAFRSSPMLMSLSSLDDGTIVEVNDASERVLGYRRHEVLGKTFEEIGWMSNDDRARIQEGLSRRQHIRNLDLHLRRKGGQIVHCSFSGEIVSLRGKKYLLAVAEDITERKHAEEQLARSAREKEELMKELQHRVKNNLSLIAALLGFGMDKLPDDRSKQAFVDAQNRIRSMSRIYEQLYQSSSLGDIEADIYLSQLATSLVKTYALDADRFRLHLRIDPVKMDMKRMVPLGLIVNELMTNALKYAYPDGKGGEVRLTFEKLNKNIVLAVSDDGVGLPKGINLETLDTLGLRIVSMLADQIEAELAIEGARGTSVSLTFRL